jgi:hypothetical protein
LDFELEVRGASGVGLSCISQLPEMAIFGTEARTSGLFSSDSTTLGEKRVGVEL